MISVEVNWPVCIKKDQESRLVLPRINHPTVNMQILKTSSWMGDDLVLQAWVLSLFEGATREVTRSDMWFRAFSLFDVCFAFAQWSILHVCFFLFRPFCLIRTGTGRDGCVSPFSQDHHTFLHHNTHHTLFTEPSHPLTLKHITLCHPS